MIKNLLFDLGGVIMDIRKENCVAAFDALGLRNATSYFGEYSQQGPFMALERGDISPAEFHAELRPDLPAGTSDEAIDHAFMQFLIGIPRHRLEELRKLREKYKIYLLSNTNPIMWHDKIAAEFRQEGLTINDYFDGIVTSYEARALKPDAAIFRYAEEKLDIKPSETIFFDDSKQNTDAAAALGFETRTVLPGSEFIDLIPQS